MFTTPEHFKTGSASSGSKRAKQYPGNSGQSIFFLRSFQRLHRVRSAGRRRCAWSRAARARPARVSSASRPRTSSPTGSAARGLGSLLLHVGQALVVGALELVVLPLDDRLGSQPLEEFVVFLFALVGEDPVADLVLCVL